MSVYEVFYALFQFFFEVLDGFLQLFLGRNVVARRENGDVSQLAE